MTTLQLARSATHEEPLSSILTAVDLSRSYGDGDARVHALRGISLEIEEAA